MEERSIKKAFLLIMMMIERLILLRSVILVGYEDDL